MGSFRVAQDVEIIHFDGQSAVIVAGSGIPSGERLLLDIPDDGVGDAQTRLVLAGDHFVRMVDDAPQREVSLRIVPREGEAEPSSESQFRLAGAARGRPVIGSIVRRVPVRLLEVSVSGGLWEAPVPFDAGTVGFLETQSADGRHSDAVRIRSSSRLAGMVWQHRAAVEFLTLGPPSPASLRGVATLFAARPVKGPL